METRYLSDDAGSMQVGETREVFGWYEKQEWIKIRLVKLTKFGWLVERIAE